MVRAPSLMIFGVLAFGILVAEYVAVPILALAVGLMVALGVLLMAVRTRRGVAVASLGCMALAGGLASQLHRAPLPPVKPCHQPNDLWRVRVDSPTERSFRDGALVQRVDVLLLAQSCQQEWWPQRGRVRVGLWSGPVVVRGDELQLRMRVAPLAPARNPGDPDPSELARRKQWSARGRVVSAHVIVDAGRGPLAHLDRWRAETAQRLEAVLPRGTAPIAKALALGDRGAIDPAQRERWARAGMAHLLAISGLHVGIIAAALFFLFRLIGGAWPGAVERFSLKRMAAVSTIPLVVGFCCWTGAAPSTLRATIMAVAVLVGIAVGRPSSTQNALGIAGILLLLADPLSAFDPSFLLSFAAVAALLHFGYRSGAPLARWGRLRQLAVGMVLTSVVATLATAPLTATFFGQVSLVAPVTNLLAVPWATLIATPAVLIFVAVAALAPGVAPVLSQVLVNLLAPLDLLARAVGGWQWAAIATPPPNGWELVSYLGVGVAAMMWFGKRRRGALIGLAVGLAILFGALGHRVWSRRGDGTLTVIHPYVGQGESTVVVLPQGGVLLFDAGGCEKPGCWDPGRNVIARQLRRLNIHSIDVAVISHPHPDHLLGFEYVTERFPVAELWWTGKGERDLVQRAILKRVVRHGGVVRRACVLPPRTVREGVEIEILHPRTTSCEATDTLLSELSENDSSLALRLSLGERSILLGGDVEAAAESMMVKRLTPTDVLKVPHHGSRTSSTRPFLAAVGPRAAIVSCGEGNRFGLPHPDIVARYQRANIRLLRTDRDGMIVMRTAGKVWEIVPMLAAPSVIPNTSESVRRR